MLIAATSYTVELRNSSCLAVRSHELSVRFLMLVLFFGTMHALGTCLGCMYGKCLVNRILDGLEDSIRHGQLDWTGWRRKERKPCGNSIFCRFRHLNVLRSSVMSRSLKRSPHNNWKTISSFYTILEGPSWLARIRIQIEMKFLIMLIERK